MLGANEPDHLIYANLFQICLGLTALGVNVFMTMSKQIKLDTNAINHSKYTLSYSELHRLIRAKLFLLRMNDSSYASSSHFLKTRVAELNRIEESALALS